jgi:phosphoserine phosphatase
VSGSAELFIAPFLQALKITQHLCIRLDKSPEGVLTGKLLEPQTIGIGKQQAVLGFLARHDIAPSVCFAVGDHHTDLPMLELVGHPVVVAGDLTLEALAKLRHWPVLRPQLNRLNLIKWSQPAPQHN